MPYQFPTNSKNLCFYSFDACNFTAKSWLLGRQIHLQCYLLLNMPWKISSRLFTESNSAIQHYQNWLLESMKLMHAHFFLEVFTICIWSLKYGTRLIQMHFKNNWVCPAQSWSQPRISSTIEEPSGISSCLIFIDKWKLTRPCFCTARPWCKAARTFRKKMHFLSLFFMTIFSFCTTFSLDRKLVNAA